MESNLFGVSAQTDRYIWIWHSLYTLPKVIVPISGVHLSNIFRFSTLTLEGVSSLWNLSSDWQRYWDLALLIYSTRSYCAYFWCAPLQHIQVFLLLTRMESNLFGVSAQTDSGIRIWHYLYTLTEVIVPTSDVQLSNTFRYFYFQPEGGVISLGSQLRLIVVLGIGIPYILYQKLLCLPLMFNSPTLSGISTFSQKVVSSLWGLSSD